MTNIWQFVLQTLSVSLVAVFLIIIKNIFKDKLPPRWQHGAWVILALRILIPVRCDRFVLLPFGIYLEALKSVIEAKLDSAFATPYAATEPAHIFPYITDNPKSITDILFIIYVAGVILALGFYIFSYIRLRLAIKKGSEVTTEENDRIKEIFDNNKVKFVKVVCAEGIKSAFICGVFKPILVLPSSRQTDERIILHETMHLKHKDSLQSIFWCILRCLHWCNPFMHYVFNVIGNDTESLCDQRVLERLEGEERREYGVLLLNEVNNKYARLPGTTSVSNGGKNISRRIEAIVRFKKYPPKMALAGICIIIVAAVPCLFVSAEGGYSNDFYHPVTALEFEKSLACSRTYRCTTVAGAIDTYAKGLINQNGIMILTASPSEKHEEIINKLHKTVLYDSGFASAAPNGTAPFSVFNLIKTSEGNYSALLVCSTLEEDDTAETDYRVYADAIIIPIEIFKENNAWVVVEAGDRMKIKNHLDESVYLQTNELGEALPPLFADTQKGENGSLETTHTTTYNFDYKKTASDTSLSGLISYSTSGTFYDNSVYLDAEFSGCLAETVFTYTYNGDDYKDVKYISAEYTRDINTDFSKSKHQSGTTFSASSSTDGSGTMNTSVNDDEVWDRTVENSCTNSNLDPEDVSEGYYPTFKYAIYIDGTLADKFVQEVG